MIVFDNTQVGGPRIGIRSGVVGGALNEAKSIYMSNGTYREGITDEIKEIDQSVIGLDQVEHHNVSPKNSTTDNVRPGANHKDDWDHTQNKVDPKVWLSAIIIAIVLCGLCYCFVCRKKSFNKQWAEATKEESKSMKKTFIRSSKKTPDESRSSLQTPGGINQSVDLD